jgi:ADP-heptose:LPS heptosyltransferase
LAECLAGRPVAPDDARLLVSDECSEAFFRVVVEGLADRFEADLCLAYAHLFAYGIDRRELAKRYGRIRVPRPCVADPRHVFVLSRVTLGADVAVTSVLLDALKRRFPEAAITLVGPRKNAELFAGDERIGHREVSYPRGTVRQRLEAWPAVRDAVSEPGSIVVDPDSRLTQLGLLPVCPDENYYFFESRAYGGDSADPLSHLAARWAQEVFGVADARPYLAVPVRPHGGIAVSFGVGDNPAKRVPDPFEAELLGRLAALGRPIVIDRGAGGEEAARVGLAVARSGAQVTYWDGTFAGFASFITGASLYVGYDSAGQHVAAAAGVPLVSVFSGFACPRMYERWRPTGAGRIAVIRAAGLSARVVLQRLQPVLAALA